MFTVGPAFFSGGSGVTCPSYLTVTLSLLPVSYTPPAAGTAGTLSLLPCPYTPPPVI